MIILHGDNIFHRAPFTQFVTSFNNTLKGETDTHIVSFTTTNISRDNTLITLYGNNVLNGDNIFNSEIYPNLVPQSQLLCFALCEPLCCNMSCHWVWLLWRPTWRANPATLYTGYLHLDHLFLGNRSFTQLCSSLSKSQIHCWRWAFGYTTAMIFYKQHIQWRQLFKSDYFETLETTINILGEQDHPRVEAVCLSLPQMLVQTLLGWRLVDPASSHLL